jgi:hypothetical protein
MTGVPTASIRRIVRNRNALELELAAVGYAIAVACIAWPLPTRMASHRVEPDRIPHTSVWAKADIELVAWLLAWDAHRLATNPLEVFQANILYPAPDVLASSEHLLGLAPIAAPTSILSGNAVLTYNVTLLAIVWISALSFFALARACTGAATVAFLAGLVFAFCPTHHAWTWLHVSAVHLFPLSVLLVWWSAAAPRSRACFAHRCGS